jgi:hypothetical protein
MSREMGHGAEGMGDIDITNIRRQTSYVCFDCISSTPMPRFFAFLPGKPYYGLQFIYMPEFLKKEIPAFFLA